MLKQLKFNTRHNNIFFYSDIHDSHEREFILNPRGFSSPEKGRKIIKERWNNKVTNNDIVFLLGDSVVGAGDVSQTRFEALLEDLNYKEIYIMPGNHFAGYRQLFDFRFNDKHDRRDYYERLTINRGKIVHFIPNYYEIIVNRQFVVLSHYPLASWNEQSKGSFHIHGHTHSNLIKSDIGKYIYKGKILDVGVESVESPISFDEVKTIMDNREIVTFDHH